MKHIAILDFGSQYTHLIARNIREMNVLSKIYPHDVPVKILQKNVEGIILSGGPQAVYDETSIKADAKIFTLGVPILGLCYGHQLIAHLLGGQVKRGKTREYGRAKLHLKGNSAIYAGVRRSTQVWMSHGDSVVQLPKGFVTVGTTKDCPITAMADEQKKIYGFQYHPEVDHTLEGRTMLENFVLHICKAPQDWQVKDIVADLEKKIKQQAKGKKVFVLCSGGVDSNVAFTLLTRALGEQRVKGLYIDTGFMRQDESREILDGFQKIGLHNLESVDASDLFFKRLEHVFEPEQKRNIIGRTFLDVKDQMGKKLKLDNRHWLLGQGTIYPDTIESGGTKHADKIKTHHNRVDAIQKLLDKGLVVEPLVEFYKHEVRQIGTLLQLPEALINRHPFPGPGLAIRCLCYEKLPLEKDFSSINNNVVRYIKKNYPTLTCSLLPVKSVGVQGDGRTYAHPLAVWGEANWKKLDQISSSITNAVRGVNRVVLLLNPSKQNQFLLPKQGLFLTRDRIDLLREIDNIVMDIIRNEGLYDAIWQFPVVLIPITDNSGKESIVLRPFNTRDVMTFTFYHMPKRVLQKITAAIVATGKISHVFYDITNKPPGTTEWE